MILDAQAKFSVGQTVTTGTDTGLVSEHTIDIGSVVRDIGNGKPMYIVGVVNTAFTSAGNNETLDVNLITDGDAALGSPTVLQKLFTFPAAAAAGTKEIAMIAPGHTYEQYIGLQYKTGGDGTALTAGAVECYITDSPDLQAYYASGSAIS